MAPQAAQDLVVDRDVNGPGGQAYRLYRAAFSRTPDAEGLGYHIGSMQMGEGLASIAANFLRSPEFSRVMARWTPAPSSRSCIATC